MDFWSRDVEDSFDEMFDLNRDERLDIGEQAYEQDFLLRQIESDDDEDEDDLDDLDLDELEFMEMNDGKHWRKQVMLPDDFDYDF